MHTLNSVLTLDHNTVHDPRAMPNSIKYASLTYAMHNMTIACKFLQRQETMQQTKTSIIAAIKQTAGDSLADLYIPVMWNTTVATFVRLPAGTIDALALATTALAIKADMTHAAEAAVVISALMAQAVVAWPRAMVVPTGSCKQV